MPRERGLPGWAVAAILLVVWEVVGRLGLVASGALPAPSAILVRFWADRADYPAHVWATLQASTLGFLVGNAVAVLAGIAFVLSPRLLAARARHQHRDLRAAADRHRADPGADAGGHRAARRAGRARRSTS